MVRKDRHNLLHLFVFQNVQSPPTCIFTKLAWQSLSFTLLETFDNVALGVVIELFVNLFVIYFFELVESLKVKPLLHIVKHVVLVRLELAHHIIRNIEPSFFLISQFLMRTEDCALHGTWWPLLGLVYN